ncbi:LysR family transcriptional regulator [Devosia psychrophila]|jgi:DNA-binding transcriptional LysR family regulator|uniref:DNA-binding transcriptional regulator, LysR family n=1 Tax=Devosia psychrophila TaxID=728005 RepID=A0A0F5Q1H4_9HYPH|nr:LysR family transcriptional regulator [Devosia psychrophila]KKC33929.1 LysR family transcriptional regulator [Devosia psychrophila]SFC84883.1 DNA-binding transcriptional regulator, LysR family [Devosia psychrophila]
MDTRFLESFVAVVEFGSMAEAGRRLNLTAAGVAQRLRVLEEDFGIALVTRVGRRVHPTEAGVAVFAKARVLLQGIRELRQVALADTESGELRLGAVSTAMTGILPRAMRGLHATHPNFNIFVAPGTSMDLYERVVDGDLDAAIIVAPPFRMPKTCDWRPIRTEPLLLIRPESLAMEDPRELLSTQPFIRYDRNHWGGRLAENYLRYLDIVPEDRFELDALEAIAVMVDSGLGVSLVPDWAPPWPEGIRLTKTIIPNPEFARHIGLVWLRASNSLRTIGAFLDEVASAGSSD